MAGIFGSALVQEGVSRGISFVLGKREEKASHGHTMERLEVAASELELALERSARLPITDVSLLQRRKMIRRAYVEAMELLDEHKPQASGQEQDPAQGGVKLKRKRWDFWASKNMSIITPTAACLNTDDVRRFEWFADCAGRFLRDVESCCSLHHYTFCSHPLVRHLLEGKTLLYYLEQGNLVRDLFIWPMRSDERGVEAVLRYSYDDRAVAERRFSLLLVLRLSESTDIVGVATKCLQLLTPGFKLAAEFAMGQIAMLLNLQDDIAQSYGPPWVGIEDWHINHTQDVRPDPACCKGSRHGLCASTFPEQVSFFGFNCYISSLEPSMRSISSFDEEVGMGSNSRVWNKPPLMMMLMRACFAPHHTTEMAGDVRKYRHANLQEVVQMVKSDAVNWFLRQPERTEYAVRCFSKHGGACFAVTRQGKP